MDVEAEYETLRKNLFIKHIDRIILLLRSGDRESKDVGIGYMGEYIHDTDKLSTEVKTKKEKKKYKDYMDACIRNSSVEELQKAIAFIEKEKKEIFEKKKKFVEKHRPKVKCCGKCGYELRNQKFCPNCGAKGYWDNEKKVRVLVDLKDIPATPDSPINRCRDCNKIIFTSMFCQDCLSIRYKKIVPDTKLVTDRCKCGRVKLSKESICSCCAMDKSYEQGKNFVKNHLSLHNLQKKTTLNEINKCPRCGASKLKQGELCSNCFGKERFEDGKKVSLNGYREVNECKCGSIKLKSKLLCSSCYQKKVRIKM